METYKKDHFYWPDNFKNNRLRLIGNIATEPVFFKQTNSQDYYFFYLNLPTKTRGENLIPIVISDKNYEVFYNKEMEVGDRIIVHGMLTSFAYADGTKHKLCCIANSFSRNIPDIKYTNVGYVRGKIIYQNKVNGDPNFVRTFIRVPMGGTYDPNVCITTEYPLASHILKLDVGDDICFKYYLLGLDHNVPNRLGIKAKAMSATNDFSIDSLSVIEDLDSSNPCFIIPKKHEFKPLPKDVYEDEAVRELDKNYCIEYFTQATPPLDTFVPPDEYVSKFRIL